MTTLTRPAQILQSEGEELRHPTVRFLSAFANPNFAFEVRALGVGPKKLTFSSFFNDPETAAYEAIQFDRSNEPAGIYVVANPLYRELLHRRSGGLEYAGRGETAADHNVYRRRSLLLDCDPVRANSVSGIPATEAEHKAALERGDKLALWLWTEFRWRAPIGVDSGNGMQLLYPISLPNTEESTKLLKSVLQAIARRWSDDKVEIDQSVTNAARCVRLPGTINRKGVSTAERPHRRSELLWLPPDIEFWLPSAVRKDQLEAVAATLKETASPRRSGAQPGSKTIDESENCSGGRLDVERWLSDRECDFREAKETEKGWQCWQITCPFNKVHEFDAAILQAPDGQLVFKCLHNSCSEKTWAEARDKIGRPTAEHYSTPKQILEAYDDPHRLARSFRLRHYTLTTGEQTLVRWRDEWYRWDGVSWIKHLSVKEGVVASIKKDFNDEPEEDDPKDEKQRRVVRRVTRQLTGNVVQALESMCHIPGETESPSWLRNIDGMPQAHEIIALKNGLLHAAPREALRLLAASPAFFTTTGMDYSYDPAATCPNWEAFLQQLWPNDAESIATLQEYAGYLLTQDTSLQKLLMIVGPTRSGKGTICRCFKRLIGMANTASPKLASLADPFGLQPLLGKSMALVTDARLSGRNDKVAVLEALLSITGEDPQDVNRKGISILTGIRLPVRFVIMSNELPQVQDAAGALASRVILLILTGSFLDREDTQLTNRLLGELSGIFNWSLVGLQRLWTRGRFLQPSTGRELLGDLQDLSSPISQFVREQCIISPSASASPDQLYQAWKNWCHSVGRDHPGTKNMFCRDLRTVCPLIRDSRPGHSGPRPRIYVGIGLRGCWP